MERSISWKSPKTYLWFGVGALALIFVTLIFMWATQKHSVFYRMPVSYAQPQRVAAGQDLDHFSRLQVGSPTASEVFAVNDQLLDTKYLENCDKLRWKRYPQGYYCVDRLQISQANTLVPHELLRLPDYTQPPTPGILGVLNATSRLSTIIVLADRSSQENMDQASAIVHWINVRTGRSSATLWVFNDKQINEFIDHGRHFDLDSSTPGATGALGIMNFVKSDAVVFVSGLHSFRLVANPNKPIIGFCTTDKACQGVMNTRVVQASPHGILIPLDILAR